MNQLRPRKVIHTGSVLAAGMAIDLRLVTEEAGHSRILELIPPGSDVFRAGSVLIARFRAPMRMQCDRALGTPLVRYGRVLSACPLSADERAALEASEETAVLVSGGAAAFVFLDNASRVDVSLWLDVSDFKVIPALRPLGKIALEPRAQLSSPADVRRSLGVAPLDAKSAKLLQELRDRNAPNPAKPSKSSDPSKTSNRRWISHAVAAAVSVALKAFPKSRRVPGSGQVPPASSQATAPPMQAGLRSRIQRYLARALWSSQFGHLLGRQYGKYFSRLLDMFDGNDLDNALRHALSLDGEVGSESGRLPLWTPSPREDLSIKTAKPLAANSLGLGGDLYGMLRERYRRAFQRLEALGEIEKAAFVLAELLNANEEAAAFLEKHGRFRLAAEVAEARNLAPGLVIRLWFLAGDRERAIRIARRTGAFADAVVRLDASHKKEAAQLRLIWAHTLAEAGQYAAAVSVAWPVEEARNLAAVWIDRAIETGGASGARMLARKLRTDPQDFAGMTERIIQFLKDGDENFIGVFGQELLAEPPLADEVRLVARATARRLIPELRDSETEQLVKALVIASGDQILRADMRGLSNPKPPASHETAIPLALRTPPLAIWRPAADRGTIALSDAAVLPDGKVLAAAGELGALLLSREGKTLARFSEPANRIVISDHGDRAILLAKRGDSYRLTRLDLLTKRLESWCDARFDRFAPDFDGLNWFVARGGALYAIDVLAKRWEHIWKVDESLATITSVQRNAGSMSAFFKWEGRYAEAWTYDYPSLLLRQRRQINQGEGRFTAECVSASGSFAGWRLLNDVFAAHFNGENSWFTLPITASGNTQIHCLTREWIVQSSSGDGATAVYVLDCASKQVRARIEFEGADVQIAARIQDASLTVCDSCGRVLVAGLATGSVLREHRVSR